MTVVMKLKNFTLPSSIGFEKLLEKDPLQLDTTVSLFDFTSDYVLDGRTELVTDDSLRNLKFDANASTVTDPFVDVDTLKGLSLVSGGAVELDSAFDVSSGMPDSSFMIQVWMTRGATLQSGFNAIAAHGFQGTVSSQFIAKIQWSMYQFNGTSSINVTMASEAGSVSGLFQPIGGDPTLVTIAAIKTVDGYDVTMYANSVVIGSGSVAGDLVDPLAYSSGAAPSIGKMQGFASNWDGVVNRVHIATLDDGFDVPAYIAQDISTNKSKYL